MSDILESDNTSDSHPRSHLDELSQHSMLSPDSSVLTSRSVRFNKLTHVAHKLGRSIVNDSVMSRNVYTNIIQCNDKIRKKRTLKLYSIVLLIVSQHQMRRLPIKL